MQLPPLDELVLVSGVPPIRAKKARYYEDKRLAARVLQPPSLRRTGEGTSSDRSVRRTDDWSTLPLRSPVAAGVGGSGAGFSHTEETDPNSGIRREPALPEHEAIIAEEPRPSHEFAVVEDDPDDDAIRARA